MVRLAKSYEIGTLARAGAGKLARVSLLD